MKVEVVVLGPVVPNSPYGLCGHKATLDSNNTALRQTTRCNTCSSSTSTSPSSDYGLRTRLYRLGLSHTHTHTRARAHTHTHTHTHTHRVDCPCETDPRTPQHVLQSCPMYKKAWTQHWPPRSHICRKDLELKNGLGRAYRQRASSIPLS